MKALKLGNRTRFGSFGTGGRDARLADDGLPVGCQAGAANDVILGTCWLGTLNVGTTGPAAGQILACTKPVTSVSPPGQVVRVGGAKVFEGPLVMGPIVNRGGQIQQQERHRKLGKEFLPNFRAHDDADSGEHARAARAREK